MWRDDAVKIVFPLPVLAEGIDPRAGGHLATRHDQWVGVAPADVTDRLFRLASGAGRFSVGQAADAAGAPTTLLLVPRALAGNVPGVLFGRSEVYTWLKCAVVDEDLGSGLARCPLSHRPCAPAPAEYRPRLRASLTVRCRHRPRPSSASSGTAPATAGRYSGQIDVYRRLAARGLGTWLCVDDFRSEIEDLEERFAGRARWEAAEFGRPDVTRSPPGSLLFRAIDSVVRECKEREARQRRAEARARPRGVGSLLL